MTRLIGDFRDRAKTPKMTRFFCKSYGFRDNEGPALLRIALAANFK
jgi:hypothetical protein